jgi:cellulose synthase/poly-beta-1,6-N-acetylglucosamine synthase-like glycosyltransferase
LIFLLVIPIIYTILFVWILSGFKQSLKKSHQPELSVHINVSIVIAARNEEHNIPILLKSISQLNYPSTHFEVIIANDHSEDNTSEVCNRLLQQYRLRGKVILSTGEGKKHAIADAVKQASGALIITTDADCTFRPDWLNCISDFYQAKSTGMMLMPVVLTGTSFIARLQHVESVALAGVSAGSLQNGYPMLSNGAAMAFEKEVYEQISKIELRYDLASGDDMFLMLNYYKNHPGKVHFINHSSAMVSSKAQGSVYEFLQQRIRWSSKTKYYKQTYIKLTGLLIILYSLLILAAFVIFISHPVLSYLWLLGIPLFKMIVDYFFLKRIASGLQQPLYGNAFLVWQLVYPFYIVITGLLSVSGHYKWKGRSYRD